MQFPGHSSQVTAVLLAAGMAARQPTAALTQHTSSNRLSLGLLNGTSALQAKVAMLSAQPATVSGAGRSSGDCAAQQTADFPLSKQQASLTTPEGAAAQQQESSSPQDTSTPRALTIFCNGNYGVYLVARRAVQCLCQGCSMSRATDAHSDCWLVSPTEFERHSGMATAKKWRSSIRVAHAGEPDITLGRWLDTKGLTQKPPAAAPLAGQAAAAAAQTGSTVQQQQQCAGQETQQQQQQTQQLKAPLQQHAKLEQQQQHHADRDGQCQDQLCGSARQLGQLLAAHYKQQQNKVHSKQAQRATENVSQQKKVASLTEEQPLCSATPADSLQQQQQPPFGSTLARAAAVAERQLAAGTVDGIALLAPAGSSNYAAAALAAAAAACAAAACRKAAAEAVEPLKPFRPALPAVTGCPASSPASAAAVAAAASQAAAEAEQAAAAASGKAYQHRQQQQQQQHNCSAAATVGVLKQERAMPAPLQIPCPRDETAPIPLEEAAAAAARGDDSLWLRSPVRRTPRSARGTLPTLDVLAAGLGRKKSGDAVQAAASEAYRQLASSAAQAGPGVSAGSALVRTSVDGVVAAALAQGAQAASAIAKAEGAPGDSQIAVQEKLLQEEELVPIGPAHQADLPQLRPLPTPDAAAALLELRKAGRPGPCQADALAIAIEEKARSDLLPRDAVEDVWQRSNGALALERAQRHRKAPGWQAAFIDPLKPYSLVGGPPGGAAANGNGAQPGHSSPVDGGEDGSDGAATAAAAGARGRKRSAGPKGEDRHDSGYEQLLQQQGKRLRCGSSTGAASHSSKARRSSANQGNSACMPCGCNDPHCPVNAAAAAQHAAQQQHPSGLPRGPAAVPLHPPVPSGWSQGSGLCRTPIGPQLLSWLLLNPASVNAAVTPNANSPAVQTPVGSRAVSEVAGAGVTVGITADVTAVAAVGKQEGHGSGGDASSGSPESSARDGTAAAAVGDGTDSLAAAAAAAAGVDTAALAGKLQQQTPLHSGASSDTATDKQQQQQQNAAEPQLTEASVSPAAATCRANTAAAAAANSAPTNITTAVNSHGVVEVRMVLDGCIFVGQLQEAGRLEMARSRVAAALQPISDCEVHDPAPLGTCCALCHTPEVPGCHADQATAAASTGMSRLGLGPLMPISMGPAEVQQQQQGVPEAQQQQQQQQSEVVWVHRQCALWSPEVYPDRRGVLMHLPGAIQRGRATRCSRCGAFGATLKCAERSCLSQFHVACARQTGCTLIAEPYTVACPAHPPKAPEPQNPSVPDQLPPNLGPEPNLRCHTSIRPSQDAAAPGAGVPGSATAAAAAAPAGGLCSMDIDTYDSDVTPTVGCGPGFWSGGAGKAVGEALECEDEEMSAAALLLSGFKKMTKTCQSRLRRQSHSQDFANNHSQQRQHSPDEVSHDQVTPYCGEHSTLPASAAAAAAASRHARGGGSKGGGRSSRGNSATAAAAVACKLSAVGRQMKDSRGRFMSHAAAAAAGGDSSHRCSGSGSGKNAAGRAAAVADPMAGGSAGTSPWLSGQAGPDNSLAQLDLGAAAAAVGHSSEDGAGSEASGGTPLIDADGNTTFELGGTTGQPGRAGRCAVCVIQRKGKCGTESAPKRCLRRQLMQQQKQKVMALAVAAAAASAMQPQNEQQQQKQQGVPAAVAEAAELAAHLRPSQQPQCAESHVAAAAAAQDVAAAPEPECVVTPIVEGNGSAATAFADALHTAAMVQ